jgi:hypothetical protein
MRCGVAALRDASGREAAQAGRGDAQLGSEHEDFGPIERQAFGIAEVRKDVPPGAYMTPEELERSIRADIIALYPDLVRPQLMPPSDPVDEPPQGVAPRKER